MISEASAPSMYSLMSRAIYEAQSHFVRRTGSMRYEVRFVITRAACHAFMQSIELCHIMMMDGPAEKPPKGADFAFAGALGYIVDPPTKWLAFAVRVFDGRGHCPVKQ